MKVNLDEHDDILDTLENTYTTEIKCANCGTTRWFHEIPKGTPIIAHLRNTMCPMCFCPIIKARRQSKK